MPARRPAPIHTHDAVDTPVTPQTNSAAPVASPMTPGFYAASRSTANTPGTPMTPVHQNMRFVGYVVSNPEGKVKSEAVVPVDPVLVSASPVVLAGAVFIDGILMPFLMGLAARALIDHWKTPYAPSEALLAYLLLWVFRSFGAYHGNTMGHGLLGAHLIVTSRKSKTKWNHIVGRHLLYDVCTTLFSSYAPIPIFLALDVSRIMLWGDSQVDILSGQRVVAA